MAGLAVALTTTSSVAAPGDAAALVSDSPSATPTGPLTFCQAYEVSYAAMGATHDDLDKGSAMGKLSEPIWTGAGDAFQAVAAAADAPSAAVAPATVLADYYHSVGAAITRGGLTEALSFMADAGLMAAVNKAGTELASVVVDACTVSASPTASSPGGSSPTATTPSSPAATTPTASATTPGEDQAPIYCAALTRATTAMSSSFDFNDLTLLPEAAVMKEIGDDFQAVATAADAPTAAVQPATVVADYFHDWATALATQDHGAMQKLADQALVDAVDAANTQLLGISRIVCQTATTTPSSPSSSSAASSVTTSSSALPTTTTPSSPASSTTTPSTPPASTTPRPTTPPASSTTPPSTPGNTTPPASTTPHPSTTAPPSTPASTTPRPTTPASNTLPVTTPPASTTPPVTPPASTTPPVTPPASTTAPKKASVVVSPANATLTLVNGQVKAPVVMTATGTGFQPNERVTGVMNSNPLPLEPAQVADAQGRVTFTWPLPPTVAAGQHSVVLTGDITGPASPGTFTVTRVETTAPPTSTPVPTSTAAPSGTVTVTQSGMTLTVKGTGFAPGDTVKATISKVAGSTSTTIATLTAAVADASGNVTFTWKIPAGTASGTYAITMTGSNGHSQSKQFTLTAAKDGGVTLAGTGPSPQTNVVGVLGLLAVAVGASCVLAPARRRRRPTVG